MVATGILAILATSMVSLFIQNYRTARVLSLRTQAVTSALTILEQIKFLQYTQVNDVYLKGASGSFDVRLADPATSGSNGFMTVSIPVNVLDGSTVNSTWKEVNVYVDKTSGAPPLPMKFFLCLTKNKATSGTKVDLFEVVILYQWLTQGRSTSQWQTGNVRLVVPSLNPMS